ncbi:MAG TPA: oxidoreductase family protein [Ardenticatenaceae bacterium]|nr:oxidoreductase family protein [Ardenticatenaceae bacterium]
MVGEAITAEALTVVLRRAGVLPKGEVLAIREQANAAFNSRTIHFEVSYSASAPSTAPRHLLLKRNLAAAWAVRAGAREVAFYQMIARLPERLPMIVPCYDAVYDAESGNSHVLLQDLSATHRAPLTRDQQMIVGENVPAGVYLDAVVDTLARFHAYWWEHAWLGTGVAELAVWCRDEAHYQHEIQRRAGTLASLLADESAWFPEHLRRLIEHTLARLPRLWERYLERRVASLRNMTLIHNDAYFANFLCPIDPASGGTYLIDWQGPAAGRGAQDLVNLCATFWTPAQRRAGQREVNVLRRYHEVLRAQGVSGYTWEELLVDYRLEVIEWLFQPLRDRADGAGEDYWWPKLQCLAAAFQDLECAELL